MRDNDVVRIGRDAVLTWVSGLASEYTSTLLSAEESDGVDIFSMLLDGDFPGGRVTLTYRFELAFGGLLRALTISV